MVTSRPFLAKIPASLASVSGAKPVQPEMPIATLVCAIAGVTSMVAPSRAAAVHSDFIEFSPFRKGMRECDHAVRRESNRASVPNPKFATGAAAGQLSREAENLNVEVESAA